MSVHRRGRSGAVVAEVSAAIGDVMWTTSELISEAGRDARLRAAIVTATGAHDAGTTRRLGALCSRVEGAVLAGFRVERGDADRDGAVRWRVLRS